MEQRSREQARVLLLDLYVVLLTALLVWPLLIRSGYPVARDMVFTPEIPWRPEVVGVGSGSPRAVPLDAVLAALTAVVDGAVVAKLVIPLALLLAGWGAHRMVRRMGLIARFGVAGLAVWNPFVIERLGLGQWALIFGYAAVIHLVRVALVNGPTSHPGRTVPWLTVGALTPTGALLAGGSAIALWVGRRRLWVVLVLAVLIQLPWVLPGFLSAASVTSDPAGVAAFAARGERAGGAVWSLIGLGGIWDGLSVPGSRTGWLGHLTSSVVVISLFVGWRSRQIPGRIWILGVASFALAALSSTAAGRALLEWAVGVVPGAGLLRDAQKWLVGFVVLVLLAFGSTIQVTQAWIRRRLPVLSPTAAVLGVLAPLLLLPDGTVVVHQIVRPLDYPSDYREVAERVNGVDGILVTLPWRLYQDLEWAGDYPAYDPSSRWFDVHVVTSDDLVLGDVTIRGEDPTAAAISRWAIEGNVEELRARGVRFALLHHGAETDDILSVSADDVVYSGPVLVLLDLDPAASEVIPPRIGWSMQSLVVLTVDLLVLLILIGASLMDVLVRPRNSATVR